MMLNLFFLLRKLNDDWALKSAKANVERYYPVVGILEEINATLEVFENKIPYFFKGVQNKYYRDILGKCYKEITVKLKFSLF